MVETFDEVLLELGNPGKFRILLFLFLTCNLFPMSLNSALIMMSAITPRHRCKILSNNVNESIPLTSIGTLSSCKMWVDPSNHSLGTTGCLHGYHYEIDEGERFVVTEFDLVCDKAYICSTGLSIGYAGRVLGGLIYGYVSDRFGRKKALISAMTINSASSITLGFVNSPYLFYGIVFFLGFSIQSLHSAISTSISELFHPRQRTVSGILMGIPWSLSLPLIACLFWWLKYWRHVQMIVGFAMLIALIYNCFLPESIQWHMARGEVSESMKICEQFARFNKQQLPAGFRNDLEKISSDMMASQAKSSKGSYKELFTSPDIRKYTFILGYGYFTALLMYLTVAFAMPNLGGNKYLSYALLGLVEMIMRLISTHVYHRYGRRKPLAAFTIGSAILITIGALAQVWKTDVVLEYLSIAMAILGNFLLAGCFAGLNLMFTEVYPTLMRSIGIGFCMTIGRFGPTVVPQLKLLENVWEPLPILISAIFGVISGSLMFLLPETNRKSLPVSTGEAKDLQFSSTKL